MTAHVQSTNPDTSEKTSPALMQLGIIRATAIFGQIVGLLMRSERHRHHFVADLDWSVVPALANNQFLVSEAVDKVSGVRSPVAVVMWAMVSEEVDRRLSSDPGARLVLKPEDWKSGSIPWLVDAIGDQHAVGALAKALVSKKFRDTGLKLVRMSDDHRPVLGVLRVAPEEAAAEPALAQ